MHQVGFHYTDTVIDVTKKENITSIADLNYISHLGVEKHFVYLVVT